ncbi:MAG TPA: hypothetical protein DCE08_06010 [Ruminococcaceae bacterium]|nr:hypothetical protein [Oscillospiraceae bacterium]
MNNTLQEYKCPCCGGAITFDSHLQKMKCPYCDTEFEMETLKAYDENLKKDGNADLVWESVGSSSWQDGEKDGLRSYVCRSCGGEIIGDATTAATSCPYCGNPVVMMQQFSGVLKPDYVIPFKLDKKAAKVAMKNHLEGKRLLPKSFKDENHLDEIKGIYVPFWLYDADVDGDFRYRATRIRTWSDSRYDYTETSYFSVMRGGEIGFDHVPVDGSSKINNDLTESIEPFDFKDAVDFQTAYLAGYFADKYDVDAEASVPRANSRIKTSAENAFLETVTGYNTVSTEAASMNLRHGKTTYALFPVWLLQTSWNGGNYLFAMNGQTGKFVGNLPLDKKKYWSWLLGLTGILTAGFFLIAMLIHLLGGIL